MTSDNDPIYLNIPQNEESNKKGFLKHEERRNKTHGSGVWYGLLMWRMYWVLWNTLNARLDKKSLDVSNPAAGLKVNPVFFFKNSLTSCSWGIRWGSNIFSSCIFLKFLLYSAQACFGTRSTSVLNTRVQVSVSVSVYGTVGIASPYLYANAISAMNFLRARYSLSANPGWFMSRSGSNLVIRWLQLSRSDACLGNHGSLMLTELSASRVTPSRAELWRRFLISWSKYCLVMSTLTSTSNWRPSFLDGRDSTWVTVPLKFSIVFKILASEPIPSLRRRTSAAFCTVFSLSGHSAIVLANTTSSSVSPASEWMEMTRSIIFIARINYFFEKCRPIWLTRDLRFVKKKIKRINRRVDKYSLIYFTIHLSSSLVLVSNR